MTFQEFIDKWNGKGIDFDGAYGDQCMDLMHQFCVEVFGLSDGRILAAPAAKDVYLNYPNTFGSQYFDKIDNTPTGIPQKGDIVFWGTKIGQYGHVAIFSEGDANKFKSFDQNFPIGSKCHIQDHTYNGVLGWLRFKQQEPMATITQKDLDEMRLRRDELYNQNQELIIKEGEYQHEILELQNANKTLNDKIGDLAKAIEKDALEDSDTLIKLIAAQKDLDDIAKGLGVQPYDPERVLRAIGALKRPSEQVIKEYTKLGEALEEFFYKRIPKGADSIIKKLLNIFKRR